MSTFQKKHLVIRLERINMKNQRPIDKSVDVRDQEVGSKITGLFQYTSSKSPSETLHESNLDLTADSESSRQDRSLLPIELPVKVKEEAFEDRDIVSKLVSYPPSNFNVPIKQEEIRFDHESKSFEDSSTVISSFFSQDSLNCERSQKTQLGGFEQRAIQCSPSAEPEHVSSRVLHIVKSIKSCSSVSCVPYNAKHCASTVESPASISDFESGTLPSWNQASVQTNCSTRVTEEFVCKEEITSELVEYSSSTSNEAMKWEDDSCECKPLFPADNFAVGLKSSRKIFDKTQEQLEVYRTSKLRDVSVKIVDIFPSCVRKLGEAHSSSKSCACIFCRGEYKCDTRLPYLPGEFNSQFRVVSNQSAPQSGRNSTDIKVSHNKILFECNECKRKFTKKSYLYNHFKAQHVACSPRSAKFKEDKLAQCLKKQVPKRFKCDVCSLTWGAKSCLITHMRVHTKERPFTCNFCPKTFTQSSAKNAHIRRVHMKMRPFNCNLCQRNFVTKPYLEHHVRSVHLKQKPYSCKLCPAKFSTSANRALHVKSVHRKEKPYACSRCEKKYSQSGHLSVHVKAVHLNHKHSCELCSSKFAQRSELARHHKVTHLKERPFVCDVCDKAFGLRHRLITHIRIVHNGEKAFSCKLCTGVFKQLVNLKLHMQTKHSNERPFSCDICHTSFKRKSILNGHMLTHDVKRCFSCAVCSAKFKTKRGVENHLQSHDSSIEKKQQFSCGLCPAKFSSERYAQLHLKSVHQGERPHSCNQCSAKFKQKQHLGHHLQAVHGKEKSFSCGLCPAKFATRDTIRLHIQKVHLGERPHRCNQCTASFKYLATLTTHIQVVHLKEKRFSCDVCSRKFSSKASVQLHLRKHQKDKDRLFSCGMCSKKLTTKYTLRKHQLRHHAGIA